MVEMSSKLDFIVLNTGCATRLRCVVSRGLIELATPTIVSTLRTRRILRSTLPVITNIYSFSGEPKIYLLIQRGEQ